MVTIIYQIIFAQIDRQAIARMQIIVYDFSENPL